MTRYGTIIDNRLHPAPRAFMLRGAMVTNPKAEHFAAWNAIREQSGLTPYLPIVDEPPTTDATHYARPTGWAVQNDSIVRQYDVVEIPPPTPRVFSKLKVVAALKAANVWDAVKSYIIDADLYDLFLAAQDFAEDNQYFTQGRAQLQQALGWTDEQVEAILAASVKEGY